MNTPAKHATFAIEHVYPAAPSRVFAAWADPAAKARWFAGPASSHSLDFRVGGHEVTEHKRENGPDFAFASTYQDIAVDARIVYTSTLAADGVVATVSTTIVEFFPEEGGTRQVLTEYGVFLDSLEEPEWRETGTRDWLENLTAELGHA